LAFIDERLQYLNAELTDVEKNVELYKRQNAVTDVSSEAELSLKNASDYNKQLAEFDIQLELLKSIEDYLLKPGDEVALVPSALNIQDPTLHILISKFNELQLERQRMQRTMQPDNPLMLNINEQLSNLRVNIGENIKNIRNGLVITRQNLIASSRKFEYRKKRVPAMERELLEINRQQSVKAGLYLYLLQKREESALSLAATVSNFRVIDPPAIIYPIFPNKPMIYMIAILVGLMLPFSVLYVRNLLNDKVMDLKDIEKATHTPVLGEIARNDTKQTVVGTQDGSNPLVEMFRLIRTNLQFATLGKPNKVILVTSSTSGEGKSFLSINLAASLVLTGKRVVVLGMDLRRPTLLKSMKIADGIGITNYLIADNISVSDILRPSNVLPNLFVISSGPALPSPTELMMSPKVGQLFDTLRASFDHIIIDSAPIGLVADGFTLAPYLDSTIYVVRRNYTPQDSLEIIEKIYRERTLKFPMIVLNDTIIGRGKRYGYGYGYGYNGRKTRKTAEASVKKSVSAGDLVSAK
ncbi:MAG TPA: polysaccharide biosynthesis tyrosine autokinase, partial [Chryseosolibacter sp.]|nr:polysaccharide biosynthesis tyrosine autokinase [Chryseosolibacter sp.]